jgi:hypothetical protein
VPDLIDEVQEELRAERAQRFWKRFGSVIAGVLLLVLAAVGGWQFWQQRQAAEASNAAQAFLAASRATEAEGADLAAGAARFAALTAQGPAGYRTLAAFRAAALQAETGRREEARANWNRIASDNAVDALYRDLASLMWALHGIETEATEALEARLRPLAAPGAAWRASAQELLGLVALRRNDAAEARRLFEALANDVTAPPALRDRADRVATGLRS